LPSTTTSSATWSPLWRQPPPGARLALQAAGLVRKATLRGKHRKKRQGRPLRGMLLFQDGSTHAWLPDTPDKQHLIVTLDDATGQITSIFLTEQVGTMSNFTTLSQMIPRLFGNPKIVLADESQVVSIYSIKSSRFS